MCRGVPSVAIAITTFRNPLALRRVLENMLWSGLPDVPVYVFQDHSPMGDAQEITKRYTRVLGDYPWISGFFTSTEWGCMQGSIELALAWTDEDWMIYVPDDVSFTRGALWNEYMGVLAYGRDFVGGIQAPYWNLQDVPFSHEDMYTPEMLSKVPRNPHWEGLGVPRKYINLNGAGFSISRRLWQHMGGWPSYTWRLDEYAGYMAWKLGYSIITLPGPPRVHKFGGATPLMPQGAPAFHSVEAWVKATGKTPEEAGEESRKRMSEIPETVPEGCFNDLLEFYGSGGRERLRA